VLAVCVSAIALGAPRAQTTTTEQPASQPWDAGTRNPDWQAPSNLTITNDCKKTHSFSISIENAPFLSLNGVTHVTVPGKKSMNVPAVFSTNGMAPGDYTGIVTILCLDCAEVPPCVQDRKTLAPHVTVVALPASSTTPTSTTPTSGSNSTNPTGGSGTTNPTSGSGTTNPTSGSGPTNPTSGSNPTNPTSGPNPTNPTGGSNPTNPTGGAITIGGTITEGGMTTVGEPGAPMQVAPNCNSSITDCDELRKEMLAAQATFNQDWENYWSAIANAAVAQYWADYYCEDAEDGSDYLDTLKSYDARGQAYVVSVVFAVRRAWDKCLEAEADEAHAEDAALGAAILLDASWEDYDEAAAAYQECVKNLIKSCPLSSHMGLSFGNPFSGSDLYLPWPNVPTSPPGQPPYGEKTEIPKTEGTNTNGGGTTGGGTTGGGTTEGGTTGGGTTGGGTTPGENPPQTQSNPCPPFPENCDLLKAKWLQLKNLADVAQALADQAKKEQDFNNQIAAGLETQADSAQASGDADTAHAKEWQKMAGNMDALAQTALQRRNAYPPGSPDWNSWNDMYQDDLKEEAQRNQWANELEESESKNDALAAKLRAEAAQLRNNSTDLQAKADQAKAEADAAYKAWQECLARKKAYDDNCKLIAAQLAAESRLNPPEPAPAPPKPEETPAPKPPAPAPDATGQVGVEQNFVLSQHGIGVGSSTTVIVNPVDIHVDHPGLEITSRRPGGSFTFVCRKPGTYTVTFETDEPRKYKVTIVCPEPEPQ